MNPAPQNAHFHPPPFAKILYHPVSSFPPYYQNNNIIKKEKDEIEFDDSTLVANFVKKIFSNEYDVMIASDGIKGIELINDANVKSKVKACLLDLNMPNMNGFQVMDYFNQNGIFVKTPVAIISDTSDQSIIDKASTYPVIDILSKPFNDRDVQRVVEKCLAAYF